MTEYWRSNARHWCAVCQCWMDAKAASIRLHEAGRGHRQASEQRLQEQRAQRKREGAAHDSLTQQLLTIQQAAAERHRQLDGQGGAHSDSSPTSAASATSALHPPQRQGSRHHPPSAPPHRPLPSPGLRLSAASPPPPHRLPLPPPPLLPSIGWVEQGREKQRRVLSAGHPPLSAALQSSSPLSSSAGPSAVPALSERREGRGEGGAVAGVGSSDLSGDADELTRSSGAAPGTEADKAGHDLDEMGLGQWRTLDNLQSQSHMDSHSHSGSRSGDFQQHSEQRLASDGLRGRGDRGEGEVAEAGAASGGRENGGASSTAQRTEGLRCKGDQLDSGDCLSPSASRSSAAVFVARSYADRLSSVASSIASDTTAVGDAVSVAPAVQFRKRKVRDASAAAVD